MSELPLSISLTSPGRSPLDVPAIEAVLPGTAGVFTVLPGHTPLLTTLTKGVLIAYGPGDESRFFAIHDGFAEVLENRISILAEILESGEDIDAARAKAAEERARERLHKREPELDMARAEAALARSLARIQAHDRQES